MNFSRKCKISKKKNKTCSFYQCWKLISIRSISIRAFEHDWSEIIFSTEIAQYHMRLLSFFSLTESPKWPFHHGARGECEKTPIKNEYTFLHMMSQMTKLNMNKLLVRIFEVMWCRTKLQHMNEPDVNERCYIRTQEVCMCVWLRNIGLNFNI